MITAVGKLAAGRPDGDGDQGGIVTVGAVQPAAAQGRLKINPWHLEAALAVPVQAKPVATAQHSLDHCRVRPVVPDLAAQVLDV